ncbi:Protein of unknown function [Bacillus mycoides]|uniref:hypothetical protein n=1 Tax=Bacillus mycoides TaxID=1405 RepID=UPI00081861F0|nr:hypothetical protein [Bacillus mycoides]SCA97051.1 Protein of unknown function [Bacillus mycoides]
MVINAIYGTSSTRVVLFEKELSWDSSVTTLVWIGVVSMLVVIASALKLNSIEEKRKNKPKN